MFSIPQTLYTITCLFTLSIASAFNLFAQNATDFIKRGDQFAQEFEHESALAEYKKAYKADTSNCTALWKMAETHINMGEESNKTVQRQHYYIAEKWARKVVRLCPDEPNGHFFVAVASGLIALYEGGKRKINRSVEVRDRTLKTLELDPDHHGAYHVLGRWHRELANINWFLKLAAKIIYGGIPPGASNEEAIANFKKAIEISPNWINHYKELGLTYMKMKKWEEAREAFETALELPISDHQDEFHKQESRKLLEKIRNKS